jgi:hypothetical protein
VSAADADEICFYEVLVAFFPFEDVIFIATTGTFASSLMLRFRNQFYRISAMLQFRHKPFGPLLRGKAST